MGYAKTNLWSDRTIDRHGCAQQKGTSNLNDNAVTLEGLLGRVARCL